MPYTVAFVDTGKPKPERYTVSLKRQIEASIARKYSKSRLKALTKSNRAEHARRANAKLDHEHLQRRWDFEKIRSIMAAKLLSRVKRPEQTMREAYKVFGVSSGNGITKVRFARALRNLGLELTPAEINDTFDHLDADGGGFIDFEEMVQQCFAPDYARKTWNAKRCEQIADRKHTYIAPDEPNFPASISAFRPSTDQHELTVGRTVLARSSVVDRVVDPIAAVKVFPVAVPSQSAWEPAFPPLVHEAAVYVPGEASVVHAVPSESAV